MNYNSWKHLLFQHAARILHVPLRLIANWQVVYLPGVLLKIRNFNVINFPLLRWYHVELRRTHELWLKQKLNITVCTLLRECIRRNSWRMSEKKKLQNKQIEKRVQGNTATWSRGNSEKVSQRLTRSFALFKYYETCLSRRAVWIDVTVNFASRKHGSMTFLSFLISV